MRRGQQVLVFACLVLLGGCSQQEPVDDRRSAGPEMPRYPSAFVDKVERDGTSEGLYLTTLDKADRVIEFYEQELTKAGWTVKKNLGLGAVTIISAERGKRTIGVQIFEHKGKRKIHQAVKDRKKVLFFF